MYLALYRKWRPKTFDDVISQPHITKTLQSQIENNRISHAYLFTGSRGTGKTTCSKIFAMAVNCEQPTNGNPCLICHSCIGIEQGTIVDVVEMDAASNNGVDDIRQLREEANFTPTQCKYRVYIIDEVHMLSTAAFNAFLKLMEEPPAHALFILATTETHKIPATILSRCQRFDFRRIKTEDIEKRLLLISQSEEYFTLEQKAAQIIARISDGGMRDALSILDQCIAFSPNVTAQTVIDGVGIVGRDYLYKLSSCIIEQKAAESILIIDELYSMSKELSLLLEELIFHFRNIMLLKTLINPEMLVRILPDELEQLEQISKKISLGQLLLILSDLQVCYDNMAKSSDKRLSLELCLIKLCTPSLNDTQDGLVARIERIEAKIRNGVAIAPTTQTNTSAPDLKPNKPQNENIITENLEEQLITKKDEAAKKTAKKEAEQSQENNEAIEEWVEIISVLEPSLSALLKDTQAYIKGGFAVVELKGVGASMLKKEEYSSKVEKAIEDKTGKSLKLKIETLKQTSDKPTKSQVDNFLERAKSLGVQINENI